MREYTQIELLIIDLDNTLYDWISFFVPAFYRMIDVAVEILQVDRETLLTDIQKVHQKYGNSEHPFALLETGAAINRFPGKNRAELAKILDPAFHAFNKKRKELLRLFPGVFETLKFINESGCTVVAHTEADVLNSLFRINALGIRQFLSYLYAPRSEGLGHPEGKVLYADELKNGFLRLLPREHRKPSPKVLEDIFVEYSLSPMNVLYVGDSITKDISMAKRAGAHAAWARYGTLYDKTLWEKLVRVTHWTAEDVARESQLRNEAEGVLPDVNLESFTELTDHYEFGIAPYEVSEPTRDAAEPAFNRFGSKILSGFPGFQIKEKFIHQKTFMNSGYKEAPVK
ncbi:MAG: HAD family hydrolase [Candidatus Aminicenantes bacterium]|nr:HAD family hydrolase [Candidatus Aminicenantes bacterium]